MTIEELKQKMIEAEDTCRFKAEPLEGDLDPEVLHMKHDSLLLEYINNTEISEIFNRTRKWYC